MSFLKSGFLAGPNGDLHVSIFTPENGAQPPSWAIYVPPFAEEMNKCRGMMSRQARALADQGYTVVSIDLSGTGDSEGDFETTDWDSWKADLLFLSDWILRQGAVDIVLWAVRAGCLLAADLVQNPEYPIRRAVFWQPVHSGRQHIAQFLRVRMAASLMKGGSAISGR